MMTKKDLMPRAATVNNAINDEKQTPKPKSDLVNCLIYIRNQCGKYMKQVPGVINTPRDPTCLFDSCKVTNIVVGV